MWCRPSARGILDSSFRLGINKNRSTKPGWCCAIAPLYGLSRDSGKRPSSGRLIENQSGRIGEFAGSGLTNPYQGRIQ
jgi:hypothetical protein